jgi:MFS family permease
MGALKRYQIITMVGAVIMVVGSFLITRMTPETSLLQAMLFMILAGLGTGVFFTVPTLAAQNAVPASQMGVSTAATRYLGQLGATLGIAIVGTVVNSSTASSLTQLLPTDQRGKLLLAAALQHGFVAILVFTVMALLTTFFLKDVPFVTTTPDYGAGEASAPSEKEPVSASVKQDASQPARNRFQSHAR